MEKGAERHITRRLAMYFVDTMYFVYNSLNKASPMSETMLSAAAQEFRAQLENPLALVSSESSPRGIGKMVVGATLGRLLWQY